MAWLRQPAEVELQAGAKVQSPLRNSGQNRSVSCSETFWLRQRGRRPYWNLDRETRFHCEHSTGMMRHGDPGSKAPALFFELREALLELNAKRAGGHAV